MNNINMIIDTEGVGTVIDRNTETGEVETYRFTELEGFQEGVYEVEEFANREGKIYISLGQRLGGLVANED